MSKFNKVGAKARTGTTPIQSTTTPVVNARGGIGYTRDAKSELFMLGISNFVGEKTFHEASLARDTRWGDLVSQVAVEDSAWIAGFLPWLRTEANMRSASLTGALVAAKAMVDAKIPGARQIVSRSLARADEPGEAIAFWLQQYGRVLPKPVKRGIADAVVKLYNERSLLKYDTASHGVRFGDVIQLVHPKPPVGWKADLYKHAIDRRYDNTEAGIPGSLEMLIANRELHGVGVSDLDADDIKAAGLTWENMLSKASPTEKREAWEKQIPSMGYMALLRNLRNFDEAGVSQTMANEVIARLSDPDEVAKSHQFPYRFLSAFDEAGLRWSWALEQALNLSLRNIPELPGRTLVLVDRSGSMFHGSMSGHSKRTMADAAAIFGVALAVRNGGRADLVQFGDRWNVVPVRATTSVLQVIKHFQNLGGTNTAYALRSNFKGHDRVVIITDEQHQSGDPSASIPEDVPIYTFNLQGYRAGSMPNTINRVTLGGGLTDTAFKVIPMLEAGRNGVWPWEAKDMS